MKVGVRGSHRKSGYVSGRYFLIRAPDICGTIESRESGYEALTNNLDISGVGDLGYELELSRRPLRVEVGENSVSPVDLPERQSGMSDTSSKSHPDQ
jgi:hypothetical protein